MSKVLVIRNTIDSDKPYQAFICNGDTRCYCNINEECSCGGFIERGMPINKPRDTVSQCVDDCNEYMEENVVQEGIVFELEDEESYDYENEY